MNEDEKTGFWLLQTEHIRGHLWHRHSITLSQVLVTTEKPPKRLFNVKYGEPLVL